MVNTSTLIFLVLISFNKKSDATAEVQRSSNNDGQELERKRINNDKFNDHFNDFEEDKYHISNKEEALRSLKQDIISTKEEVLRSLKQGPRQRNGPTHIISSENNIDSDNESGIRGRQRNHDLDEMDVETLLKGCDIEDIDCLLERDVEVEDIFIIWGMASYFVNLSNQTMKLINKFFDVEFSVMLAITRRTRTPTTAPSSRPTISNPPSQSPSLSASPTEEPACCGRLFPGFWCQCRPEMDEPTTAIPTSSPSISSEPTEVFVPRCCSRLFPGPFCDCPTDAPSPVPTSSPSISVSPTVPQCCDQILFFIFWCTDCSD